MPNPILTTSIPSSISENTIDVGTPTLAPGVPGPVTWSIVQGGIDDGGLFNIDPVTGHITFINPPNFENPTDRFHDNTYDLYIRMTDATGISYITGISFNVTNVNEPPVFSPSSFEWIQFEHQISNFNVAATDPDNPDAITYSIVPNVGDGDKFNINPYTGLFSFKTAPDYESPTDLNGDNTYDITFKITDFSGAFTTQEAHVNVLGVNEPPTIAAIPILSVPENTTGTILNVASFASDIDSGTNLTYAIVPNSGNWDLFNINPQTGHLSFVNPPDYENPQGTLGNSYQISVVASDGTYTSQARQIQVNVTDAVENSPPNIWTINAGGGGSQIDSVGWTIGQNAYISDPAATDPDAGQTLTWSIAGGVDAALFTIDPTNGYLSWVTPPVWDPSRALMSPQGRPYNEYNVTIQVDDGHGGIDTQALTVGVARNPWFPGVDDNSGPLAVNVDENTTFVTTLDAQDNLGPLIYSIDPNVGDADKFTINPWTGSLSFINAPDYENPDDVGTPDGVYDVRVLATDLSGRNYPNPGPTEGRDVRIFVQNVGPQVVSYGNDKHVVLDVAENTTGTIATVQATGQTGMFLGYSIDPNHGDADKFTIDQITGQLSFINPPDYENPQDFADGAGSRDNGYDVRVIVQDFLDPGRTIATGEFDTQDFLFNVTDVNENTPPDFTDGASVGFGVYENVTAPIYHPLVTDPDAGQTLTYSIVPNAGDWDKFTIDSSTGALSFVTPPNFENPQDFDNGAGSRDNIYDVTIQVDDGNGGIDTQDVVVHVANVNEAPQFENGIDIPILHVSLNEIDAKYPAVAGWNTWDPEAGLNSPTVTVTVSGPDADLFEPGINPQTIKFITPPDFENPTDANGDNVYEVDFTADDGQGGINVQHFFLHITNSNEVPEFTSYGGVDTKTGLTFQENVSGAGGWIATLTATDPDTGQNLTFSLPDAAPGAGEDNNLFDIDPVTGDLSWKNIPDFENPADVGGDNLYRINAQVSDGNGGIDNQAIELTVIDNPNDNGPQITSFGGVAGPVLLDVRENDKTLGTITAVAAAGLAITYSIDPNVGDASKFIIDPLTGALAWKGQGADFENPTDVGAVGAGGKDNVYDVAVIATDSLGRTDSQSYRLFVQNDANETHTFKGTINNDTYGGENGADTINGIGGNDTLTGYGGNDKIDGGANDDNLFGSAGNDTLTGYTGNDKLFGGSGNDDLDGGDGADNLVGGAGDDKIAGGAGDDIISAGPGKNTVDGGAGTDYMLFSGSVNDYTFSINQKKGVVTGITGPDGQFTSVSGIEAYHFEDGSNLVLHKSTFFGYLMATAPNGSAINSTLASRGVDSSYYHDPADAQLPPPPVVDPTHHQDWLI